MRIHSRQLLPARLAEGLGTDTRRALSGLSDVRSAMSGLLSAHGEDVAQGTLYANGPVSKAEVSFVLAATESELRAPRASQELVVNRLGCSTRLRNDTLTFKDGAGNQLVVTIPGLNGRSYPRLNLPYRATLVAGQTLVPNAPTGPFAWFMLTGWVSRRKFPGQP